MSTKLATREDEITRVALRIHEVWFKPAKDPHFQPRKDTVLYDLWKGGRLTLRHQKAWFLIITDHDKALGKSGPVTSNYGESSNGRNPSEFRVPTAYENASLRRVNNLYNRLIPEQRRVLDLLLDDDWSHGGTISAEIIGALKVGYGNKDQARAAGVATVACLLDAIAGFYEV